MLVKPYFPDIIQGVVSRVNAAFSQRTDDPFNVFFDKGLVMQVRRSVYAAQQNFPLVWLVMKYDEIGGNFRINSTVSFQLIIAMPTDHSYTQQQREDISYKPRLLPIIEQLLYEIGREKWFSIVGPNAIKYIKTLQPYWGMSQVPDGTGDMPNLWQIPNLFIDAVSLTISSLVIRNEVCTTPSYGVPDTNNYPVSSTQLTFYDDLELIVDGGQETDPVAGQSSVTIPFLIGKQYEVQQRGFGQLRQRRSIEIIPDTVNGGFALAHGSFATNDTYFIIIRPQYIV